jgi:hypothetical protein
MQAKNLLHVAKNTPSVLKYKTFKGSKFVPKYKAS